MCENNNNNIVGIPIIIAPIYTFAGIICKKAISMQSAYPIQEITLYSFFTLPLGILYIYCIKKNIDGKWILRVYSMLKNFVVLFLLNSLLGLNTFTDAKDIYYSIVGLFPFLESDFLKNGMFIILWIVLSFSEVYIIKVYTNLFILRMNKNKMMK